MFYTKVTLSISLRRRSFRSDVMSDSDALLDALRRHANEEKALRAERRDNLYCALFILIMFILSVCCIVIPIFFM